MLTCAVRTIPLLNTLQGIPFDVVNGKRPMQVVVAAMRKLLHLAFGVLKSGKPFNPKLGVA
jgi:hypothetical protein